ncbi:sugar kinase [Cryobacterium tepidiphilum]|uniref:Sugar kinase n=1 Tax=Cryobacterium tepidiphilum TaxID=2486026 RepID=A0A3M8LRC4_9MICO|nr:sugar kinase [Cryobacterium tepidiphilum]RNE67429.1 sugar kinase [Cryobacterium tepidiphilum]
MSAASVVTFGETMASMSSGSTGPLQHTRTMNLSLGGAESNFAVALHRLGVDVTWIGRVGDDALGDLVLREIGAEGIRVVGIRDPDAPTGLMIKEHRTSQETRVWYYRKGSAGSRLNAVDIDPELIRQASLLHVTGITPALSESAAEATFEAIRIAKEAGVTVSFDLNFRGKLWTKEQAGQVYRRIIADADLVFAGDDEAAIAVGAADTPLELAHRLVDLGAGEAIVKLGAHGAVALAGGAEHSREAIKITAVDTVGAGDGFVAGYLAEYLLGEDVPTRLTTAVTVGAYACLSSGDWEGLPRRAELAALGAAEPVSR